MIRFLSIRDLAVIETLELELGPGLTVLTGETGAGKSIVVGALALLRGGRASSELVRTGADKAEVAAVIEMPDGTERLLRREISAHGRSRSFVDDRVVATATLRTLGSHAIDLHGQHEHQVLLDPIAHLDLLDRYAGLAATRTEVRSAYQDWRAASAALDDLRLRAASRSERAEVVAFQLRELDEADVDDEEDTRLAAEQQILANADHIHRLAAESFAELYEGDEAALGALERVWRRVADLATLDPTFLPYLEAKDTVVSQLEELAFALRPHATGVDASPDRLQAVEDRLAKLERLKRRYGPTLAEVRVQHAALRDEASGLDAGAERAADLEKRVETTRSDFLRIATTLSSHRRTHAVTLGQVLVEGLADLAMPHARFAVMFEEPEQNEAQWTDRGIDQAEFYFSANPGESVKPLAGIASGGELSRVMLAIRTVTSSGTAGTTLVFDEVDAGIGGEAAERVGAQLRGLSDTAQVLCVTHLPQIATCGTSHYRVYKVVREGRTTTTVARLDDEARAAEIARMMAGTRVSDAVLQTARELLKDETD
ncbi:MAG: DNA repair protein RecN [Acidobacteria bacterium]|nr:DNA repair protein RecN [Acidobacteriota bacterium]